MTQNKMPGDGVDGGKLAVLLTQKDLEQYLNDEAFYAQALPFLANGEVVSSNEQTGEIRWRMNAGALKGAVLRIQVSLVEPPTV